ncbi:MAG: C40 family peptidase [Muribaculaceae bacterium]|nr:C40 family peptidase [Muribaculaceae bacterium]
MKGTLRRLSLPLLIAAALIAGGCSSAKRATTGRNTPTQSQPTTVKVVPSTERQVSELVKEARKWIGTPYAYGGHTRGKGTDCSGMIMELFLKVYDLKLPRSSAMQREYARKVDYDRMMPGDLVFFSTSKNSSRVNHVGLYIGDNRMIHASSSRGVMESNLAENYWKRTYHSSGHIIETNPKKQAEASPAIPSKSATNVPSISLKRLQELYDALDEQIDSIYVSDPAIFD